MYRRSRVGFAGIDFRGVGQKNVEKNMQERRAQKYNPEKKAIMVSLIGNPFPPRKNA